MKYLKFLIIIGLITSTVACKKNRYPEVENSANAQFTRTAATGTAAAPYNTATLSKASPATADQFLLKVVESGNVKSVAVMVDYRKAATPSVTTYTQQFATITTWPQTYNASLNSLVTLFASNGLTVGGLAVGDRFVFRIVITLNSGTVISEQAAIMNAAPYAITLTYTVAA
jgi:hypothetical protein